MIVNVMTKKNKWVEKKIEKLKATLFVDGEADSCWTDFPTAVLSNDIWSDVEITILNNRMSMTVRNQVFTKTHRFSFRRPIRGDIFIGGYPGNCNYKCIFIYYNTQSLSGFLYNLLCSF